MAEDDLEPLITECPNCATRFRVTEAQLQVASGRVRCGACLTVFHGVDHLVWDSAPEFSTEDEASSALEELLSELDDAAAPSRRAAPSAPEQRRTEPWDREESRLFVGFEEEPAAGPPEEEPDHGQQAGVADSSGTAPEQPPTGTFDAASADVLADAGPPDEVVQAGPETAPQSTPPVSVRPEQAAVEARVEPPADVQPAPAAEPPPAAVPEAGVAEAGPDPAHGAAAEPVTEVTPAVSVASGDVAELPPQVSFAPEPRRWWVGVLVGVGVVALAAQIFWYQFESWGRDPTLRPVYAAACRLLGCELPVLQDLKALRTEKLLVRSHPDLADALIVDAVIVNEADFAQPFPALELRFTTIDGTLVAGRRFKPDEYLAGELRGATLMPPKTPIRLELAIDDPGGDAVNYFLTFRSATGGP